VFARLLFSAILVVSAFAFLCLHLFLCSHPPIACFFSFLLPSLSFCFFFSPPPPLGNILGLSNCECQSVTDKQALRKSIITTEKKTQKEYRAKLKKPTTTTTTATITTTTATNNTNKATTITTTTVDEKEKEKEKEQQQQQVSQQDHDDDEEDEENADSLSEDEEDIKLDGPRPKTPFCLCPHARRKAVELLKDYGTVVFTNLLTSEEFQYNTKRTFRLVSKTGPLYTHPPLSFLLACLLVCSLFALCLSGLSVRDRCHERSSLTSMFCLSLFLSFHRRRLRTRRWSLA
jgi:hypothetical protein